MLWAFRQSLGEFIKNPMAFFMARKQEWRSTRVNLLGDRDVEWAWVAGHMPDGPGEALDFGNGGGPLGLLAVQRGFSVTAVDLEPVAWPYDVQQLRFVRGDLMDLPLPQLHYDLVINCSTVEHVGLSGRYGVMESRSDGDLDAMRILRGAMKPGGRMLLTIPVGKDAVFPPITRIYGTERLPRLLDGLDVDAEQYWIKNAANRWTVCDRQSALDFKASAGSWNPLQNVYALACLVLRRVHVP